MEISNSYFEDEVREGFYIPGMVKRAWAAELKVFDEVDRICRKHDITYFADYGTLLGAVRHRGFIPWDDDFDIVMYRRDYERFLQVAETELPEGYRVFNYQTHDDFWYFLARVVAKPRICFEEEHLKEFYGFPYIVGIDIFIMDNIASDAEQEELRAGMANFVLGVADGIGTSAMKGKRLEDSLSRVEELCQIKLENWQNEHQLKVQLYQLVESLFKKFNEEESEVIAQMMPNGLKYKNLWMPKEYYEKSIRLPFEYTSIPVPVAYDAVLSRKYNNYTESVSNIAGHNYPFFLSQRKQLEAVLDFEIPDFWFSTEMLQRQPAEKHNSLKVLAAEVYKELERFTMQVKQELAEGKTESVPAILENAQQLAIDLGTLIENTKGEGLKTVTFLEQFCEVVYQMHTILMQAANQNAAAGENADEEAVMKTAEGLMQEMQTILIQIKENIKLEILDRKEAVFLPFKASYWDAMETVYKAAAEDPDCDVYVIPIPYYEKDFMGNFTVMHEEREMFPQDIPVTPYDKFDFALHHPDWIVIQNPYDEFNSAISVHTFFYSKNLRKYTDSLIYIPYFVLDEFGKEEERAYGNMRYYCTMPGVIYADKVFVQSENMRKLYIDKLAEFAGEETREVWAQKIIGIGSPKQDKEREKASLEISLQGKWHTVIEKPDGSRKMALLYGTGISEFVEYKEQALEKLRKVLGLLESSREELALFWYAELPQQEEFPQKQPEQDAFPQEADEIWQAYRGLVEKYRNRSWVIVLENTEDVEQALRLCDAYYGCGGELAHRCAVEEKPVMIRDIEG